MSELSKRLRAEASNTDGLGPHITEEAADALDAQEAALRQAREAIEAWKVWESNWDLPFEGDGEWKDDKQRLLSAIAAIDAVLKEDRHD